VIHVLFLIRSLDHGGAERQLIALARALNKDRFAVTVVTMYDGGALRAELADDPCVRLLSLKKQGRWDIPRSVVRLWRVVRAAKPHILHGYMSPPNELCLVLAKLTRARSVWGIRVSNLDLSQYDWGVRALFHLSKRLSRYPDLIIANSHAGRQFHLVKGFSNANMLVLANGIDTQRFTPDLVRRATIRAAWSIPDDVIVIGIVGRLDPMKDHSTFLKAAAYMARTRANVAFVCVGQGPNHYTEYLHSLTLELGITPKVMWINGSDEMPAIYNGFDILTSSSAFGEGFGNVIGEAMACAIPCVVTDVGDSAWIIGEAGRLVPPGSPAAIVAAWQDLIEQGIECRRALGLRARARVENCFSLRHLVGEYAKVYESLMTS
jgi:glycosyltransferase involved in cell wall biosynthesis